MVSVQRRWRWSDSRRDWRDRVRNVQDTPSTDDIAEPTPDQAPEASATAIDTAARPDPVWIDDVEREVDDVDVVLKCLARNDTAMCATCQEVDQAAGLASRPVLARCAETKQPR